MNNLKTLNRKIINKKIQKIKITKIIQMNKAKFSDKVNQIRNNNKFLTKLIIHLMSLKFKIKI